MLKKERAQGSNPAKGVGQGRANRTSKTRIGADGKPEPAVNQMDHAPMHPVYVLTDGLFRPIQHGKRETAMSAASKYSPIGEGRNQVHCAWTSEKTLDITDQLVLFHLCQLGATPGEHRALYGPKHPEYAAALRCLKWVNQDDNAMDPSMVDPNGWGGIQPASQVDKPNLVVVFTTAQAIARGIGLTATGANTKAVQESLRRLIRTTCQATHVDGIQRTKRVRQYQVLGGSRNGENLILVLNPELSERCISHQGVAWINMKEQRSLASKPARRLHAWLTAWGFTAEVRTIKLQTLSSHVWGPEVCTPSAKKTRMRTLRDAVKEIAALPGWVCWEKEGLVRVRKPRFVGTPKEGAMAPVVTPTSSAETDTATVETENCPGCPGSR